MSNSNFIECLTAGRAMRFCGVIAVALVASMTLSAPAAVGATDDLVVATSTGKVKDDLSYDGQTKVFKGLHYGQSTAGSRRFKPPVPVESWEGVRDGTNYGPTCPQARSAEGEEQEKRLSGQVLPHSEDCLVLNVWTPDTEGRRPVMFWIHGGGFSGGDGSTPYYDGTALSRRGDAVVITVNHRLNVFGYLHLADLAGEDFAGSGVAGMLDLELALKWVGKNIASFGGDPDNVTIFGESGGGFKICHLMTMPSAKGLFHKAIIQSGPTLDAPDREAGTKLAKAVMTKLKISDVQKLQEMPAADLLMALHTDKPYIGGFKPVVDGTYLPAPPFSEDVLAVSARIPLIIGSNRDEALYWSSQDPKRDSITPAELRERLAPQYEDKTDRIIEVYSKSRPKASPWDLLIAVESEHFRMGSIRLAERKAVADTAPVYMYLFSFEVSERYKAAHGMEISYAFNNVNNAFHPRPEARHVETDMSEAWIAFARTGDPNHPALPPWPAYTTEKRSTMIFDAISHVVDDPYGDERRLWGELGSRWFAE